MSIPIRPTRSGKGTQTFLHGCVWLHRGAGMSLLGQCYFVVSPIVSGYRKRRKFRGVKLSWFFNCCSEVKF